MAYVVTDAAVTNYRKYRSSQY